MVVTITYGEQIKRLRAICLDKVKQFRFYDAEVIAEKEEGFKIHQDLIDKLTLAEKELHKSVFDFDTLLVFCSRNKIDYETVMPHSVKNTNDILEE